MGVRAAEVRAQVPRWACRLTPGLSVRPFFLLGRPHSSPCAPSPGPPALPGLPPPHIPVPGSAWGGRRPEGRGPVEPPPPAPGLPACSSRHQQQSSGSRCPGASHLGPCLWAASRSPGRARGRCISVSPLGSPSSWPRSRRLGSRAGASGPAAGGRASLLLREGEPGLGSLPDRWQWWAWRGPSGNWGPNPGGRDARNMAPAPTPSGNPTPSSGRPRVTSGSASAFHGPQALTLGYPPTAPSTFH